MVVGSVVVHANSGTVISVGWATSGSIVVVPLHSSSLVCSSASSERKACASSVSA